MLGEEVLDVGGVDPPGGAELVAGQLSPADPVADRPVGDRELGGEAALGEESRTRCFGVHTSYAPEERLLHRVTSKSLRRGRRSRPSRPLLEAAIRTAEPCHNRPPEGAVAGTRRTGRRLQILSVKKLRLRHPTGGCILCRAVLAPCLAGPVIVREGCWCSSLAGL
jgi:hypothetical protein